ncbi:hypothetical protein MCOR04_011304 [Pyricularia oryzae]|nr:hypothetical protein MCOR22_009586 [Pyricularia oryzae]KAI6480489.1 hypothetical protein MCOR11_011631 [Pyricularia oryzae]KAI6518132.1 hypothetical protein MCOR05_011380 [Pyricularia oryzae]KAI6550218.1 hypothetical protein MCOR04_011304 [Pyricularia oryzae]KAI6604253.1 hypothetical protein MCOR12_002496 [Pyricularia oryzae]
MRVPCRLPDQDTMHGTKPELRPTEPSIELSEDVKERLRAAGDVEGFGRSQVWETAVCAGRLDEPGTIQCSRICRSHLANLA